MKPTTRSFWILPIVISALALMDGALHLSLDMLLFRGNFFGTLGPPPGAAPPPGARPGPPIPLPLPLNQLFVLPLIVYVAAVFLGWVDFGMPNPLGLGYLSKAIEIALLVVLLAHSWRLRRAHAE